MGSESCGSLGPLGPLMVATQAPTVTGNLVATALGMSQVKLTWAGATDKGRVRRYEVQRRDPGSTSFVQVGTTSTTSYIDTTLAAGSNYSYRVLVRDARGSLKKYSGVASVTTGSPTIVPLRSP
jgi:fibronectin type 3 domain-containing protein